MRNTARVAGKERRGLQGMRGQVRQSEVALTEFVGYNALHPGELMNRRHFSSILFAATGSMLLFDLKTLAAFAPLPSSTDLYV